MKLINTGFDNNSTYFEHNIDSSDIPNIFIHGVGLDNTMWLPQKNYFKNKKIVFYLINLFISAQILIKSFFFNLRDEGNHINLP